MSRLCSERQRSFEVNVLQGILYEKGRVEENDEDKLVAVESIGEEGNGNQPNIILGICLDRSQENEFPLV